MSHRTQITLTDEQYDRLIEESDRTGLSLAELVRRALDDTFRPIDVEARRKALDASFGIWSNRAEDGVAYVERMRRGMARRVAEE